MECWIGVGLWFWMGEGRLGLSSYTAALSAAVNFLKAASFADFFPRAFFRSVALFYMTLTWLLLLVAQLCKVVLSYLLNYDFGVWFCGW